MKDYPALDVRTASSDLLLAIVDDFAPIAVDDSGGMVRLFFSTAASRDAAAAAITASFEVHAVDVPDEDWARRSQDNLLPVTVGRLTVAPPWAIAAPNAADALASTIVILPSMGFGTGHHATTRLCLDALQQLDLDGRSVLDVGTGSGVLAFATDRLGAARSVGIDSDEDAVQAARDNLPLNPAARRVTFEVADLAAAPLAAADVVVANLTGALLVRSAAVLLAAVKPGGRLVVSGLQSHERDAVVASLAPAISVEREREDEDWVAITMKKP
ncbi:MAG TPA: 50S ribosomal protein L11 methyltransferase [Vicinamibacterales bacterium]